MVSIFTAPPTNDFSDPTNYTLGTVFTSSVDGTVTGVRWWVPATGTAPVGAVGGLYDIASEVSGTLLESKPFGALTQGDWNTVTFDTPVAVTAGQFYVTAVYTNGKYSATAGLLNSAVTNSPLTAIEKGVPYNNGRFHDGGAGLTFPEANGNGTWYGVDVLFTPEGESVPMAADLSGAGGGQATLSAELNMGAGLSSTGSMTADLAVIPEGLVDESVLPAVLDAFDCLCTQVALIPNPPANCCLRFGEQVVFALGPDVDECCEGTAWVRVTGIYPSQTAFPEQDIIGAASPCGAEWLAVEMEFGVARCDPTADPGHPPECSTWLAGASQVMYDAAAMRRAVCCISVEDPVMRVMGRWAPMATEGGCAGGTMIVTVQVRNREGCQCG